MRTKVIDSTWSPELMRTPADPGHQCEMFPCLPITAPDGSRYA